MKKLIAAIAILASASAFANGPYDGLYQSTVNEKSFALVQQSNGLVLVGMYYAIPADGITMNYGGGTIVRLSELHSWDALMGPISGNTARAIGEMINGMCTVAVEVTFVGNTATSKVLDSSPTSAGIAQRIPCAKLVPVGTINTHKRIF